MSLKRFEEALANFQRARTIDPEGPTGPVIWTYEGATPVALNRDKEALTAFEQALALDPKQAGAWDGKATVYEHSKRYEEASICSDKALALEPNEARYWDTKGIISLAMQRYDAALAAFDHALRQDDTHASTWRHKAQALRALGRAREAHETNQKAQVIETRGGSSSGGPAGK